MKNRSPSVPATRANVLFALGLALVVVLGVGAVLGILNLNRTTENRLKSFQVIDSLNHARTALFDVETSAYGFALSDPPEFTERYDKARRIVSTALASVRKLTTDDPVEQQIITELESLAQEQLALAAQVERARREAGEGAAQKLFVDAAGKNAMDTTRQMLTRMEDKEHRLLVLRDADGRRAAVGMLILATIARGTAIAMFVAAFLYYRRESRRRTAAEAGLQQANAELEQRVGERTAALVTEVAERKRAEERLVDREAHLRAIVDSEPECVKLLSAEGKLIDMNPAGLAMIEADSLDQVRGADMARVLVPEYRLPFAELTRRVFAGEMGQLEFAITGLKGAHRWVETHAVPLRGAGGKIKAMLGITRDITARKQAEAALRGSEERFRAIIEASPVAMAMNDEHLNITLLNRKFTEQFGYTLADIPTLKEWWPRAYPDPAYRQRVAQEWQAAIAKAEREQAEFEPLEYNVVCKDGSVRSIRFSAAPFGSSHLVILYDLTERKQSEAALREAEARLRLAVTASNIGLWDWSIVNGAIYFSPEWKSQLGYTEDEIPNRFGEWESRVHPDDFGPTQAKLQRFLQDPGGHYATEIRLRHKDGSYRWIFTQAQLFRDEAGQPVRMLGCHVDITERKQAEEALRASEEKFRTLTESSLSGVTIIQGGQFRYANPAVCRITGYSQAEILAFPSVLDPVDEADRAHAQEYLNLLLQRKASEVHLEFHIRRKDGSLAEVEVFASTVIYEGHPAVICTVLDVTERKRATAALRENEEKFSKAFQNSPDAVIITTLDGQILEANAGFTRLSGYTFEEAHGRTTRDLHFWADPADREKYISALREHGRVADLEAPFRTRSGELRTCLVSGERMDIGGKAAIVGVIRDITARKEAEAREAKQTARLKHLSALSLMLSGDPSAVFERVVRLIGELFDVRVVCLSEIVGKDLDFRAVYVDGQVFTHAGSCPLEVTPCATVEDSKDIRVFDRVAERFPQASFLRDHKAHAYCGFPVLDNEKRVIAVTCLLDDKPHDFTEEEQHFLRIIGQRLAIEIERGNVIVQRKQAEAALQEREERLRAALSASGTGTFRWDIRNNELSYDEALDGLFGLSRGQTIQSLDHFIAAVHPDDRAGVIERCERCAEEGADFAMEFRVIWPDGSIRWLDDRGKTFFDDAGKPLHMTGACVDITDRKRDEAALQDLARRLLQAEDAERRRIAKELHDSTAQDLVAVMMNLGALRESLASLDTKPMQMLDDSIALVENSANELRTLSYVLHPPRLDEMGLPGALAEYASGLGRRADIRIRVEAAQDFGRLPDELELVLFRVAQESLTNAIRHSHSDAATIRLARTKTGVVLEIEDFGCGMPADGTPRPGVGIIAMRERVQHLGGRLEVVSESGGTIVRAVLPVRRTTP